jgi:hypothetical protein
MKHQTQIQHTSLQIEGIYLKRLTDGTEHHRLYTVLFGTSNAAIKSAVSFLFHELRAANTNGLLNEVFMCTTLHLFQLYQE